MCGNIDLTCSATGILYDFNSRSEAQELHAAKDRTSRRVYTYFERHKKYVDQGETEIKMHEDETRVSVIYWVTDGNRTFMK